MKGLLSGLTDAVVEGDDEVALDLCGRALEEGLPPLACSKALVAGIEQAGDLWKKNIYFISEIILSAEAFRSAMRVVESRIPDGEGRGTGKVVVGTVAGDMHSLGKSIVTTMLRAAGFEVVDLGEDVPSTTFVDRARELRPDILGIGCYMTTTMGKMKEVLEGLEESGLRARVKVIIGGIPTSQRLADDIGADAWGQDALDAVEKAGRLMGVS